jgi:hypothetical protein
MVRGAVISAAAVCCSLPPDSLRWSICARWLCCHGFGVSRSCFSVLRPTHPYLHSFTVLRPQTAGNTAADSTEARKQNLPAFFCYLLNETLGIPMHQPLFAQDVISCGFKPTQGRRI